MRYKNYLYKPYYKHISHVKGLQRGLQPTINSAMVIYVHTYVYSTHIEECD